MTMIRLATWFSRLGISGDDPDLILEKGSHFDPADNNPKQVTIGKARIILRGAL